MATILYVEDHPPARLLMQAIIDDMTEHRLLLADSGAEAHKFTRQTPPDLYILDLDLPDTDGIRLAQELTAYHPGAVVLVSAYAEAVQPDALQGCITFYLAKPLDPDHVAEIIHRALAP